jgi:hypothetical protein
MARICEVFQDVSRSDDLWVFGFNDTKLAILGASCGLS